MCFFNRWPLDFNHWCVSSDIRPGLERQLKPLGQQFESCKNQPRTLSFHIECISPQDPHRWHCTWDTRLVVSFFIIFLYNNLHYLHNLDGRRVILKVILSLVEGSHLLTPSVCLFDMWNSVKIVHFSCYCEFKSKLWISVKIVIWSARGNHPFWNLPLNSKGRRKKPGYLSQSSALTLNSKSLYILATSLVTLSFTLCTS